MAEEIVEVETNYIKLVSVWVSSCVLDFPILIIVVLLIIIGVFSTKKEMTTIEELVTSNQSSKELLSPNHSVSADKKMSPDDLAIYDDQDIPLLMLPNENEMPKNLLQNIADYIQNCQYFNLDLPSNSVDNTKKVCWSGIGDMDGFAARTELETIQKVHIIKVGSMQNALHKTEFVSDISEIPIEEFNQSGLTVKNFDRNKFPPLDNNDILRSGDIVKVHFTVNRDRFLTVVNGIWLGISTPEHLWPGPFDYFMITVLDNNKDMLFGTPLIAGQKFRLRSARWPRFEIGFEPISSKTNYIHEGTQLILYDWTDNKKKNIWSKKPPAYPLEMCFVQSKNALFQPSNTKDTSGGLSSFLTLSPSKNSKMERISVTMIAWANIIHRTLLYEQSTCVLLCHRNGGNIDKKWICLVTPPELGNFLHYINHHCANNIAKESKAKYSYELQSSQQIKIINNQLCSIMTLLENDRDNEHKLFIDKFIDNPRVFDSWFLTGDPRQFNISLYLPEPIYSVIVGRCVHETSWIEETIIIYSAALTFNTPNSTKPTLIVPINEIIGISQLNDTMSPLPGYFICKIETIFYIYYIAFSTSKGRDSFSSVIANLSQRSINLSLLNEKVKVKLNGIENICTIGGKWKPSPSRRILNNRIQTYDTNSSIQEPLWQFTANLLSTLSLINPNNSDFQFHGLITSNTCDNRVKEQFILFQNQISLLKTINLSEVKIEAPEGLCFFVNVYYLLLIHGRLVFQPPGKQNWFHFFSTVSYEIGDNVFSLMELEQCVIRGILCRPNYSNKSEGIAIPANDEHFAYACKNSDPRVNFLLCSGSPSYPPIIYTLTPSNYKLQLDLACKNVFLHSFSIDKVMNLIVLPSLWKIFQEDYGGSNQINVLQHVLKYLAGTSLALDLSNLIAANKAKDKLPTITYLNNICDSHLGKLTVIK